jgi:hypothetical protein
MKTLHIRSQRTVADPLQSERVLKALRIILEHQENTDASSLLTDGVSLLQTNESNSTFWPSCHGHALLPHWSKASPPTRHGGTHDHHRFYHRLIPHSPELSGKGYPSLSETLRR